MRLIITLLAILGLNGAAAKDPDITYSTTPNTSDYPFPSVFPILTEGKVFDWKRYIGEAVSEGDSVFRENIAYSHGFQSLNINKLGVTGSAADDAKRNQIAADEVQDACLIIENMYRDRLKKDPDILAILENFIKYRREAIKAYITLDGGSWGGGSGARVAYPAARLNAFVNYRRALLDLQASLHFQDLPMIPFPTPSKPAK